MYLKSLELTGFKSFARKTVLNFHAPITAIVGPNGSGKSNVAEAFQFVLGEQSIKSLRGKRGEDMIFNGSKTMARLNRASVKVVLDNSKRLLNVDFDEVVIERIVHRDNTNEYLINGSGVRLKDIVEILSQAHMGPTGHHIISQGEADRVLNANIKERRLMIEDALGLKVYQFKRLESERKLERTRENIEQVQSLRRELAPHLRFLKKQVEKIEKARELKVTLIGLFREYLKREHLYLTAARKKLSEEQKSPTQALQALEHELKSAKKTLERSHEQDAASRQVLESEKELRELRTKKDELLREIGRLEGALSAEERRLERLKAQASADENRVVPLGEVRNWLADIDAKITGISALNDLTKVRAVLTDIKSALVSFLKRFESGATENNFAETEVEIRSLRKQKNELETSVASIVNREKKAQENYEQLRNQIEKGKDEGRSAEREIFKIMAQQSELRSVLNLLQAREQQLSLEEAEYDREIKEAKVLVGDEALDVGAIALTETDVEAEDRQVQLERRRNLEKNKIRLEELGGAGGDEIMKEYTQAQERDAFLEREVGDLEASAQSLQTLIKELTEKLDFEFKEGVHRINAQFSEFFRLMFGGGSASLLVVKEKKRKRASVEEMLEAGEEMPSEEDGEEETEEGIEISVNLPHKKIRGLEVLSGGERALTSIALLFAISQVNPPPFIVLDETDAALDEANSKKYGDMIESLSKYSQLVLITHNRETMSRAGVLYGVTMGQDGASKILSIQFEEAVLVAK